MRAAVLDAVVGAGRVVSDVAAAHGLGWWTVQRAVNAAADALTSPDDHVVRRLGIDEHRYRSVRFYYELRSDPRKGDTDGDGVAR